MPPRSPQEPSPVAKGIIWAHRITTISLEMVLPALGGAWLDKKFSTQPWLFFLGAAFGFSLALYHLVQLGRQSPGPPTSRPTNLNSPATPRSTSQFPDAPASPGPEKTE